MSSTPEEMARAMADPGIGLVRAYDELSKAIDGFDGIMEMICDKPGKEIRLKKTSMYFAMEPLYNQMRGALQLFDHSRKQLVARGKS